MKQHDTSLSSNLVPNSKSHRHTLKSRAQTEKLNINTTGTKTIKESYGTINNDIVSFEHINVNGINPYSQFVELTHTMGALE